MVSVNLDGMPVFPGSRPDKAQALKVLEEAAEVFGAWQQWEANEHDPNMRDDLLYECADVIQAVCNLAHSLNCESLAPWQLDVVIENEARGRYIKHE